MTSKVSSGKEHRLRRLAEEGAAIGDTFEFEIVLGGCGGVAAHVYVGPDVDAGGVAGARESCDTFGCSGKEEAATAAYVEDVLVAPPGVQIEHEVAMAELANFDVEEKEKAFADEEAGRPVEAASVEVNRPDVKNRRAEDSGQQEGSADEEEVAHDGWCVYAVVRFVQLGYGKCGQDAPPKAVP